MNVKLNFCGIYFKKFNFAEIHLQKFKKITREIEPKFDYKILPRPKEKLC